WKLLLYSELTNWPRLFSDQERRLMIYKIKSRMPGLPLLIPEIPAVTRSGHGPPMVNRDVPCFWGKIQKLRTACMRKNGWRGNLSRT
ncbi:MAG: hypothetical protein V3V52_05440, partial [Candidatus Adiutricales bacterium]